MKKFLSLLLCLAMVLSCVSAAMADEAAAAAAAEAAASMTVEELSPPPKRKGSSSPLVCPMNGQTGYPCGTT